MGINNQPRDLGEEDKDKDGDSSKRKGNAAPKLLREPGQQPFPVPRMPGRLEKSSGSQGHPEMGPVTKKPSSSLG